MKCFQVSIHMSGSSTSAVAVTREKIILVCFMAFMVSSWEAAEQCQMVLKELFLMVLLLLPFPRSQGQSSTGPICTWEIVGHKYFCSVTNANPQSGKAHGIYKQEVGIARAEFRIPASTLCKCISKSG